MGTHSLIGLGSNLGDRRANLDLAVAALSGTSGVAVRAVSSYHETRPVGGPSGQGPFLNAAALLDTTLDPFALLARLQAIEAEAGRVRTVRWGERTLDLDLLIHGTRFLTGPELTLPHPRMAVRRFVIAPAAEVAPDLTHTPSGLTIRELLTLLDRRPSYLALAGPPSPLKREGFQRLLETLPSRGLEGEPIGPGVGSDQVTLEGQGWVAPGDETWRQLAVLDARLWPRERLGDSWLISEFCVDPGGPARRGIPSVLYRRNASRLRSPSERKRLCEAYEVALKPTFAMVIDPTVDRPLDSWFAPFPLLWSGSNSPEAVLTDTLAACAATRAG
jgi:2-amino-4-hydroxy-6-hydroxymethyldihydropteridine diphosphokinase